MNIWKIMARILPGSATSVDSPFYRLNTSTGNWSSGDVHGGIDFNYADPLLNVRGINPVYAPISGMLISVNRSWGWVVIKADDGTYHRILHMDTISPSFPDTLDPSSPIYVTAGEAGGVGTFIDWDDGW